MSSETTDDMRTGAFPLPFIEAPVGTLDYDGHEIQVWSVATTVEGQVIFLNCSAADAAISATFRRLLRKSSGKATFQPAKGFVWSAPLKFTKLPDQHYETVRQALTYKGLRLKNICAFPDCVSIAVGLAHPMDVPPASSASSGEGESETEDAVDVDGTAPSDVKIKPIPSSFRYMLGDIAADQPPTGALFAHLKSLMVVCHQEWEAILWEHGKTRGLLVPQPALGIHAWSITRDRTRWTSLIGELWLAGLLSRPDPVSMLAGKATPHRNTSLRL